MVGTPENGRGGTSGGDDGGDEGTIAGASDDDEEGGTDVGNVEELNEMWQELYASARKDVWMVE